VIDSKSLRKRSSVNSALRSDLCSNAMMLVAELNSAEPQKEQDARDEHRSSEDGVEKPHEEWVRTTTIECGPRVEHAEPE
jgi:hypothetical protein